MDGKVLLLWTLAGAISGMAAGETVHGLVDRRWVPQIKKIDLTSGLRIVPWVVITAILFAGVALSKDFNVARVLTGAFCFFCICAGATDTSLRKVPNPMLLGMLVVRIVEIVLHYTVAVPMIGSIVDSIMALFVGFFVFYVPTMIGVPIGAGDIKLAAVIGFCLGLWGLLWSVALMGIGSVIYWAFLKMTKKGTMKSLMPMGPCLASGAVMTSLLILST